MVKILNIDTAGESASVFLSGSSPALSLFTNEVQQEHSSWLHPAISRLLAQNEVTIHQLDGIAVNVGPGSYTGLRVSLSAAKGLCYASGKPLITMNSLEMLAYAMRNMGATLLVPMIDARRLEVFTAVYTAAGEVVMKPQAMILDSASFSDVLRHNTVLFAGSGSNKFRSMIDHPNAQFSDIRVNASDMSELSLGKLDRQQFSDLAYTEPFYVKDFYNPGK